VNLDIFREWFYRFLCKAETSDEDKSEEDFHGFSLSELIISGFF
jgi:hypothetical protein